MSETLHIHGPGRTGTSLALAALRAGVRVDGVSGGDESRRLETLSRIPGARSLVRPEASRDEILLIAVPDDALEAVAEELARSGDWDGVLVVHVSGSRGVDILRPLGERGARIAGFHPLRAFADRSGGSGLDACAVAVSAEDEDVRVRLFRMAELLGGRPFVLREEQRASYHLGASLIAGGVQALLALSGRALQRAGLPEAEAREALASLARTAVSNAVELGEAAALTGPMARGDRGTLVRHDVAADQMNAEDRALYEALLLGIARLADERGDAAVSERVRGWWEERGS